MPLNRNHPSSEIVFVFVGLSGKSQIMFAIVFSTRYLDLFTTFVSVYNSVMKVIFIMSSYATLIFMYKKFRATYDSNHDTFRVEFLLVPVAGLAVLVNHEFTVLEVACRLLLLECVTHTTFLKFIQVFVYVIYRAHHKKVTP